MSVEASGFFVLRTPLLPFDEFLRWSDAVAADHSLDHPEQLERELAEDRARLRQGLCEIYARPAVREALFVASPHLEESLHAWLDAPESVRGKGLELALVRYFARMAGRATPFGLCAGSSLGMIGGQMRLHLAEQLHYQRHTRLDMDYLQTLCDALLRDATVRAAFIYRPNSSVYRAAGRWHYVEGRMTKKERSYHLVSVEDSAALSETLARAQAGASLPELAEALVDEEVSLSEADDYLGELIENQILMPDLALRVTGEEPLTALRSQLAKMPTTRNVARRLQEISDRLAAFDESRAGVAPESYRAIARTLESLPGNADLPHLFQVDMIKPAPEATLGPAVVHEIMRGVEILHRLAPGAETNDELKRFRDAFLTRYEAREVPLVEALDAEVGIGFPPTDQSNDEISPLLRGLEFPPEPDETVPWGQRENFLLQKLATALQTGAQEIILQPSDFEKICSPHPLPLPDAFSVTARIAAASDEAHAQGDFQVFLPAAGGPSGARFLGRFCHADAALQREVQRHLRAEEALRPEALFAEIVHLPVGRMGNILARPILRAHEIVYLGSGATAADCRIPVSDLLVSVRAERIVLHSARLGREIVPRLTSAHNFAGTGVGAYRLLCLLQGQGVAGEMGWSWGPLRSAQFLPRVRSGRLVLARARWNLQEDEVQRLRRQQGAARFRTVSLWRKARGLPRLVLFSEGDKELPIDFDNVLSVETFVTLLHEGESACLVEMFPGPEQLCARGPEGRFVHELIVPFVRKTEARDQSAQIGLSSATAGARTFPPGTEWLYAKLYAGTATLDRILREVVRPIAAEALRSGAADQWFFIRYGDPAWHLRLRLHGDAARLHAEVLPALQTSVAPLLGDGRIWRMQLDTYERELDRYGGPEGMALAERIFHADSEAVLEVVQHLEAGDTGLDERWRLTLCGIDMLLDDFGFDQPAKLDLLRRLRNAFAREFRADTKLKKQIGARFRTERAALAALLAGGAEMESHLSPGIEILRQRSARLAPIVAELKEGQAAGRFPVSLEAMAGSFIHMHADRLLRSAHRAHELVLYEFLVRLYTPQSTAEK